MTPVVSIIVPIYNASKKLDRCIESILNQTFKEFELILMDDGSTDESGEICDAYAKKDARVRVVHKPNTGVSDTRNQGIALAKGEYLQFLDSDDWIVPEATALFVRSARESGCDMVVADFYRVIGERVAQKGAIDDEQAMDRQAYVTEMLQNPADFYYGVLWNKLYKRSIIVEHQLEMDTSINWCEDFLFNLEYLRHIQNVYVLKVPVYYYVKTKGSLVTQGMSVKKTILMKRKAFACYNEFYKDVLDDTDYEKRKMQVYRFLLDVAGDGEVWPAILPGNYKLGDERTNVSEEALGGEGFLFDLYCEQKLQERVFDVVALRNDLTTSDVKFLYYLSQPHGNCVFKETADLLHISRRELTMVVQRLLLKDMIVEQKKSRRKDYITTAEADSVVSEIWFALNDFAQMQYEGFSQEEIEIFEKLNEKRNQNIRNALK